MDVREIFFDACYAGNAEPFRRICNGGAVKSYLLLEESGKDDREAKQNKRAGVQISRRKPMTVFYVF